ncbi:MAG: hypothetical protein AAFV53_39325 [Myxococcota bacterium]
MQTRLWSAVCCLPPQWRMVMVRLYGLDGSPAVPIRTVSQELRIRRREVVRLHRASLILLRGVLQTESERSSCG